MQLMQCINGDFYSVSLHRDFVKELRCNPAFYGRILQDKQTICTLLYFRENKVG